MARANPSNRNNGEITPANKEEDRGLLSRTSLESNNTSDDDLVIVPGRTSSESGHKTPRTPNRVRFDLPEHDGAVRSYSPPLSGRRDSRSLEDEEGEESFSLLTSREAPTVALANRLSDDGTDVHTYAERERLRPKSNLQNAFMNMANSIIGAGIIGQPYAFKQAGLLTGIILLICLTITVDWTIRLIVINSKMSGRDSFQGTVEHCFGWWGLVGISVAQWAFAFGGMVAFGVIVGDSIPHVLTAVWPGLADVPVLGVLAGRHGVIVVFILGVSWPLSLYRDIAKASSLD
jgi:sodium-coupled neutral amino acid transporter 11